MASAVSENNKIEIMSVNSDRSKTSVFKSLIKLRKELKFSFIEFPKKKKIVKEQYKIEIKKNKEDCVFGDLMAFLNVFKHN